MLESLLALAVRDGRLTSLPEGSVNSGSGRLPWNSKGVMIASVHGTQLVATEDMGEGLSSMYSGICRARPSAAGGLRCREQGRDHS